MAGPVIYVVRSWPRLSQTFIVNEVVALERRGVEVALFSLTHSVERTVQPQVADVRATVHYLDAPEPLTRKVRVHLAQLRRTPKQYTRTLWQALRHPGLAAGYGECSAWRCFDLAVRLASSMAAMSRAGSPPAHVHAHFAHDPALVGMFAARLAGVPFTFTGHARDLVQIPADALAARAAEARAVVTCCQVNAEYVAAAVPQDRRPPVLVLHHGVDLSRFTPSARRPTGSLVLVSVGRLVEKKGYPDLLHALRAVKDTGRRFRCDVYGDGPDRDVLTRLRDSLGLGEEVRFLGAHDNDRIVAALRTADLFVLAPRVAADGDRDGIPNVLVEAMASGVPVVSTRAGGVSELVEHDVNGLLAEPGDVTVLARLIGELVDDPERRRRLGAAARSTVEASFDIDVAARRLEELLR